MKITKVCKLFIILCTIVCISGCTLKFKATELEVDSEAIREYKFDGIEVTNDTDPAVFGNRQRFWQGARRNFLS